MTERRESGWEWGSARVPIVQVIRLFRSVWFFLTAREGSEDRRERVCVYHPLTRARSRGCTRGATEGARGGLVREAVAAASQRRVCVWPQTGRVPGCAQQPTRGEGTRVPPPQVRHRAGEVRSLARPPRESAACADRCFVIGHVAGRKGGGGGARRRGCGSGRGGEITCNASKGRRLGVLGGRRSRFGCVCPFTAGEPASHQLASS